MKLKRYWWAPVAITVCFVALVMAARSVGLEWIVGWFAGCAIGAAALYWREDIARFARKKLAEWRSDARQLGLWLQLAFRRNRDALDTATMTHQMQFLQGRLMSPMNLFAIAAIAVAFVPLTFGFQEWRINRVKAERDAPCSDYEMSRSRDGKYRTSRASCADLAATIASARAWRDRAIEEEARRIRETAQIRLENEELLRRETQRRIAAERVVTQQRRRTNEAIASALGGPAPDHERSLCELAGRSDCVPAAGGGSGGEAPAASRMPDGPGRADAARTADASR